jgi:hypothetical protein
VLLDEDNSRLECVVLSMIRRAHLEISMLVLRNHLESVLQWNIDIRSNCPLGIKGCRTIPRFLPVIPDTSGDILVERVGIFGKCTLAVKLLQRRNCRKSERAHGSRVASVLESSLWIESLQERVGKVQRDPVKIVAEGRLFREVESRIPHSTERLSSRSRRDSANLSGGR